MVPEGALSSPPDSLRPAGEGGDGAGDPAVREDQGHEGGAVGAPDSDLPGTGCECPTPTPLRDGSDTGQEAVLRVSWNRQSV